MEILKPGPKGLTTGQLKLINTTLSRGGLIVYPTETVYGLGADALNLRAVQKLWQFKGGRGQKAVSVAVSGRRMAEKYVKLNSLADNLYRHFLPGPVTVISKSQGKVVPKLESAQATLGIRVPRYPLTLDLIETYGRPLTATSANPSGIKPPYSLADFLRYTSKTKQALIDLFIDTGTLPYNPPSTVVDTTLNAPEVLRQGSQVIHKPGGKIKVSQSVDDTRQLGQQVTKQLIPFLKQQPVLIGLKGDLGAGKTQLVKGIAKGLGIDETVTSPTYQVMREYAYNLPGLSGKLIHIDTWRLPEAKELLDLDLTSYLKSGNLITVEWAEKLETILDLFAAKVTLVEISIEETGLNTRRITIHIPKKKTP